MRRSWEQARDEKSQLRELNSRLQLYVARVRELEQENRRLARELAGLREWELRGPPQELADLRARRAELTRAALAAEWERDELRRELGRLQRLGAEVLELRRRLEPELAGQRSLLEREWGECAALEALLAEQGRLLERGRLEVGEVRSLRLELAALPPPPPPGADLEQLEETYALVLGQARRDTLLRYQRQLQALQDRGGPDRESLERLRAEGQQGRLRLEELRRQEQELGGLGQWLERELLALQARHGAELDEYQRIIEALEEEKQLLTLSVADYLKDYHELMQVKTGLSLEVATYRALLEGENSQWIITWIDQQGTKIPQGLRNASYDYTNSYSAYREENKKKSFPIIKSADAIYKTPVTNIPSSAFYSAQATRGGPWKTNSGKALRKDILSSEYHPSNTTKKEATYERTMEDRREFKTFTPTYGLRKDTEIRQKTFPERKRTEQSVKETKIKPEQKTHIMEEMIINENKNIFSGVRSKEDRTAKEDENATGEEQTKITENELTERNTNVFLESRRRETDEHTIKPVEIHSVTVAERESNFKEEDGISDKSSPRMGTSLTENIAETIVADILKSFVQSSGSETTPDTKVNYLEKQKHDDEKETTEIPVQCQVQEDLKISDEVDLGSLLNKGVKVVLDDSKGIPSKDAIEDVINVGLKERDYTGKVSVNVEIVEEPLESVTDERSEFSTPFEVEEVEDTSPGMEGHYGDDEEQKIRATAEDFKKKKSSEILTHVEEVTEADDSFDEQRYFVSTPDDYPLAHGKDDSVYGQIHIEEESTIKYSWQDEFLQGTQRRKEDGMSSPEQTYQVVGEEASAYVLSEEYPRGEASHAESTVIEKEIKIPHEFQTSIKGLLLKETKDPKQQLKEALEQLEGNLPESVREELAALTKEDHAESSSLAVDIKKVEQTNKGGLVTIVAEVNVSQTLDADQLDIAQLGGNIPREGERISLQATKPEGFYEHDNQELKSHTDGKSSVEIDISPSSNTSTPWPNQAVYSSSRVRGKDGMEYHSTEQVICEGPVSETVELGNAEEVSQSHVSTDINKSIRHIKIGPTEIRRTEQVIYEGPFSETLEFVARGDLVQTEGSADVGRSVKHFKLGPKEIEITEEIIHKEPITKTVEAGELENLAQPQFSTDINRSIRHIRLSPKEFHTEQVIFEGPVSGNVKLSGSEAVSQTGDSVRHIKLGQKEIYSADKIVYEGPLSETVELGMEDSSHMEHRSDTDASIMHIKLGPKEFMTTEQIIYKGPISGHLELSESVDNVDSKGSIKHIILGQKEIKTTEQVIYRSSISESPEVSSIGGSFLESEGNSDVNRSIRLIKLSPTETHAEQIIFRGPISETMGDNFQTEGSSENSKSIRHIKLGPKETSFTFQMDVTNVAGVPVVEEGTQEATITISNRKDPDNSQSQVVVESDQKNIDSESSKDSSQAHGEQVTEKSIFEKSVELQRMVDQRAVISDEKKIALVYLDKEEEEGEDDGQWF
uniref:Synemin n=1 Tax=Pelusios castaneus TaxID=367368 RepID=A0A8C8SLL1_9SAUR